MEEIFKFISEKPEYAAWASDSSMPFGLTFYISKKRHEKELYRS